MALKKGDIINPKGRPKGSKNKAPRDLQDWVKGLLEKNTELFEKDLAKIKPNERLSVLQGLLRYSVPTITPTTIEAQIQAEYNEMRALLEAAPEEAIEKITEKIIYLQQKTKNNE